MAAGRKKKPVHKWELKRVSAAVDALLEWSFV